MPTRQKKLCSINFASAHLSTSRVQMDHYANGAKRTKHMFSCHLYKTLRSQLQQIPLHHAEQYLISSSVAEADRNDQAIIILSNRKNDMQSQYSKKKTTKKEKTEQTVALMERLRGIPDVIQKYLGTHRLALDFSF